MGMKWEEGFNKLIFLGCLAFVALFLALVLADEFTRSGVYVNESEVFDIKSPVNIVSPEELKTH